MDPGISGCIWGQRGWQGQHVNYWREGQREDGTARGEGRLEGPGGEIWTQRGQQQPKWRRRREWRRRGVAETEDLSAGCEAASEQTGTGQADGVGAD